MLRKILFPLVSLLLGPLVHASVLGQVQGIVHDPQHRPIAGAHIVLHAANSDLAFTAETDPNGAFSIPAVPPGVYVIDVSSQGFATFRQTVSVTSGASAILHFPLEVAAAHETAVVQAEPAVANVDSVTPTTLITMLRTAQYAWQQEALSENARAVFDLGRELYDRLCGVGKHVDLLGHALTKAVSAYNQAVGSLESRVLVSARRLNDLGVVGGELAPVAPVEETARALSAPELVADRPAGLASAEGWAAGLEPVDIGRRADLVRTAR